MYLIYLKYSISETLIFAIHELSRGSVSVRTAEFIKELERKLPAENKPVKLFFLNYDVDKCNSDNLLQLEGTIMYFSIKNNSLQISRIYGASIVCGFKP